MRMDLSAWKWWKIDAAGAAVCVALALLVYFGGIRRLSQDHAAFAAEQPRRAGEGRCDRDDPPCLIHRSPPVVVYVRGGLRHSAAGRRERQAASRGLCTTIPRDHRLRDAVWSNILPRDKLQRCSPAAGGRAKHGFV